MLIVTSPGNGMSPSRPGRARPDAHSNESHHDEPAAVSRWCCKLSLDTATWRRIPNSAMSAATAAMPGLLAKSRNHNPQLLRSAVMRAGARHTPRMKNRAQRAATSETCFSLRRPECSATCSDYLAEVACAACKSAGTVALSSKPGHRPIPKPTRSAAPGGALRNAPLTAPRPAATIYSGTAMRASPPGNEPRRAR